MTITKTSRLQTAVAICLCAAFIALSSLWLADVGLQTDEALFAAAVYPPFREDLSLRPFGHYLPLMVMTYVGSAKGWLYAVLLPVFGASVTVVRFPAILLGALTIWLVFSTIRTIAGGPAAIGSAALLSTDAMFVLTTRWDWGPVVVQHLCLVMGVWLLVRFVRDRRRPNLALAFFVFGVGLWDKAIFAWCLVGIAVAVFVFFPKNALREMTTVNVLTVILAFMAGAAPLIIYNARQNWVTFRTNAAWSADDLSGKARLVRECLEGAGLYGVIVREPWDTPPSPKSLTWGQRTLVTVNEYCGSPRRSIQSFALILAVLFLPFLQHTQRRLCLAVVVFAVVTWGMMAVTKGAGGSTHHSVLLWPAPHILLGTALTGVGRATVARLSNWVLLMLVCASNVLVTTTYYTYQLRNGGTVAWTDAIYALSQRLEDISADSDVCLLDWGFFDSLRLLNVGRLRLCALNPPVSGTDMVAFRNQIANPKTFFVTHTEGNEFFGEDVRRVLAAAKVMGYVEREQEMFADSFGRPVIRIFKLAAHHAQDSKTNRMPALAPLSSGGSIAGEGKTIAPSGARKRRVVPKSIFSAGPDHQARPE